MECIQVDFSEVLVLSQPVEQVVRALRDDAAGLGGLAAAVIEAVPLLVKRVLAERRVVSPPDTAIVVGYRKQIVDQLMLLLLLTEHEGCHVQSFQRKLNQRVELLASEAHAVVLGFGRFESLETDDHDARQLIDFQCFGSLHMLLAHFAVPHVVLVQSLQLFELLQAVGQQHLPVSLVHVQRWQGHSSRKEAEETLMKVLVPHNFDLKLFACDTTFIAEQRIVVSDLEGGEDVVDCDILVGHRAALASHFSAVVAALHEPTHVLKAKLVRHLFDLPRGVGVNISTRK